MLVWLKGQCSVRSPESPTPSFSIAVPPGIISNIAPTSPLFDPARQPCFAPTVPPSQSSAKEAPSSQPPLVQFNLLMPTLYLSYPTPCYLSPSMSGTAIILCPTVQVIDSLFVKVTTSCAPAQLLPYLKAAYPELHITTLDCRHCDVSKMHRQPFPGSFPVVENILDCIHMDLCGPITPASRGGNKYFLKIIDGHSKFRFIYPMPRKSDTFSHFVTFLNHAENLTGRTLKSVVSNNGGEFVNHQFMALYNSRGIVHHTTTPYTPQQNPFAECGNCTTVGKARALLLKAGMSLAWWGEAVTTSVYLENRSPDSSIGMKTPYELWHATCPDSSEDCFYEINEEVPQDSPIADDNLPPLPIDPNPVKGYAYVPHYDKAPRDISSDLDPANIIEGSRQHRANAVTLPPTHRAFVIIGKPALAKDPKTYTQAMRCLDRNEWLMAVEVEINNIRRHKVWVVAPMKTGTRLLDTVWAFKRKYNTNGELLKYKARFCVRGFRQIEGINYEDTFAPTGRLASLRTLLGITAAHNFQVKQMDVRCAFLNGVPDEDIYLKVLDGVDIEVPHGHGLKLQKSLYSLKKVPGAGIKR
ncbi:hypothetical protein PCANC_19049 [Puccinia coronata f. sp. avenae]|uniref:Integrase catalytic domain-containing protein n=1 Tax=Puccinia coronata f. sp. avenae TaxID=200324 RepID=A0A2N5UCY4_9BASI|nr:hypothetical protein PCANC_19049 [Puccinia coronata f. sp. avenae]